MAFSPTYGSFSIEHCEVQSDFVVTGDVTVDGTVRLTPDITWIPPDKWGMDSTDWDYVNTYSGAANFLNDWVTGEDPTYVDYFKGTETQWGYSQLSNWPKGYISVIGRDQLADIAYFTTGETHYVETTGDGWENVDNAGGWTAEFTFFIPQEIKPGAIHRLYPSLPYTAAQGGAWAIDFDDGTKKGRIWVDPFSALFTPDSFDTYRRNLWTGTPPTGEPPAYSLYPSNYWLTYELSPRTLRLTVKGDEVWITVNTGVTGTVQSVYPSTSGDYLNNVIGTSLGFVVGMISASNSIGMSTGVVYTNTDGSPLTLSGGSIPYPPPGTPTGLPNGSVYGPNGATGWYSAPRGEVPPSWRDPVDPPTQKHTLHLESAGLAASDGTKKFGFYHSVTGENVANQGCAASVLLLDNFKVAVNENHEGIHKVEFSGEYTTFSPTLQPDLPVSYWSTASYFCEIPSSGETYITPQYYSGDWQDFGELYITSEEHQVDISGIPVFNDGTDKIRFKIRQVAAQPSGEPPRVDEIKVFYDPITGDFDLSPNYGSTAGGDTVTLTWQGPTGEFTGGQQVFVGDTEIAGANITDVDSEIKQIIMPAMNAGSYMVKVIGSTYWSVRPYSYVGSYDVEADGGGGGAVVPTGELEDVFGNCRSPFRVLNTPPGHAINLALVGAQRMKQEIHMALINLSDQEPANLTGYGVKEDALYNAVSGDFHYPDAVDTDEILISNRSAMWRGLSAPTPLFYKYLVGRDRYYVHVPTATGEDDLDTIRKAITLYEEGGAQTSVGWDISASTLDYNGDTLPSEVYSVVIYTAAIPNSTLWVAYRGSDRLNSYNGAGARRETVNPVPLFDDGDGRMNMKVSMTPQGSYNVDVEV